MADSSRPAIPVMSTTPLSRMTRMIATENRMVSKSATCTARIPAAIATKSAASCARSTKTIVATIAPGPASSGVPSGTSATLTSLVWAGSSARPVRSSSATSSRSSPPAHCRAGREIPR